ncbi:MAG: nucleotide sugar dehydrogenase [Candidatus Woesearchaeota archaeon]
MRIMSIIGIGRVGLPLALMLSEKGFKVFGIDTNKNHVKTISKGIMPFIEEGAERILKKHINKNFFPTTNYKFIEESNAIIITVGTPITNNKKPDFKALNQSIKKIIPLIKKGQLLILRSTVSPGTTERIKKIIESKKSWKEGKDFSIAYCPERILEGKALKELREIPQIIGVFNDRAFELSKEIFDFAPIHLKTNPRSAELAKLFSNMYRYILFAIPNEFLKIANYYNVDFYEVRDLVNFGYKRANIPMPGFTAGPCLQKDGFFLVTKELKPKLILAAHEVNENLPEYFVNEIEKKHNFDFKNKKAVILGMAFKANIDDARNSLSFKLKEILEKKRAKVYCHDPYIKEYNVNLNKILKNADVVFIAQPHDLYKKFSLKRLRNLTKKGFVLCDVWKCLKN